METLHTSEDQLELYALDRLSDAAVITVEEHLLVCEPCRERLEQGAAFAFSMHGVLKQHPELSEAAAPKTWFGINLSWFGFSLSQPRFAMVAVACFVIVASFSWVAFARFGAGMNLNSKLLPVASLQLVALRGDMQTTPAARALDLILTDAPATGAPFKVELVDAGGSPQWTGSPRTSTTGLNVHITKSLPAGAYFTRLYDASGKLIHEYGFRVENQ